MKKLMAFKSFVVFAALVCGVVAVGNAADWTYDGTNGQITEVVTDGATPWVLTTSASSLGEGLMVGVGNSFGNAIVTAGSHETIDLSGTVSDGTTVYTIVEIGNQSFRGKTNFTGIVLPQTLRKIVGGAFYECTKLSSMTPMLPDSLEYLGVHAFKGCTALKVDVVLRNKDLELPEYKEWTDNTFTSSGILSMDLSESGVTQTPLAFVRACPNLKWVKYPKTLVAVGGGSHYGCSSLMEVQFNSFPTWSGDTFGGTPAYSTGSRITYPAGDSDWLDYVNRKTGLTRWANASVSDTNAYCKAFPDGPTPVGYATIAASNPTSSSQYAGSKWLVPIESETATCELVIAGDQNLKIGSVTPDYGSVGTVDSPVSFSVENEFAAFGDQVYQCKGYKIGKLNGTDVEYGELVGELSGTFDPADKMGSYYVCWQWEIAAHRVTVVDFPTRLGDLAIVEPCFRDFAGFYPVNQPITVRATPKGGAAFERWFGDVPAAQLADSPLSLTIDAPKTVQPYFSGKWVLNDEETPISMTDGYWTFPVIGTCDALVIGRASRAPELVTLVDLQKGVEGGGTIAAIAQAWFSESSAIVEVRLPDTVKVVPRDAFRQCSNLQKIILPRKVEVIGNAAFYANDKLAVVEPELLPHSVTSVEATAFCNCSALKCDLVLSNPKLWLELSTNYYYSAFFQSGILTADLARTRLERLPNGLLRECPNLVWVKYPKTLKELAGSGMHYCSSKLKDIQFRSWPADFGTTHTDAFGGTPGDYKGRIVYPKGDPNWTAYIEKLKQENNFTAWEDAGNNTNTYLSAFSDGWKPVGYSIIHKDKTFGNVGKWLVPHNFGTGSMILVR